MSTFEDELKILDEYLYTKYDTSQQDRVVSKENTKKLFTYINNNNFKKFHAIMLGGLYDRYYRNSLGETFIDLVKRKGRKKMLKLILQLE